MKWHSRIHVEFELTYALGIELHASLFIYFKCRHANFKMALKWINVEFEVILTLGVEPLLLF